MEYLKDIGALVVSIQIPELQVIICFVCTLSKFPEETQDRMLNSNAFPFSTPDFDPRALRVLITDCHRQLSQDLGTRMGPLLVLIASMKIGKPVLSKLAARFAKRNDSFMTCDLLPSSIREL